MSTVKEDPIAEILKKIAPGTPIREGLDNILKAKTGALLLITDKQEVIEEVVDGGFFINEDYTSSKLYELAKMDGAIVLSGDMKKICVGRGTNDNHSISNNRTKCYRI